MTGGELAPNRAQSLAEDVMNGTPCPSQDQIRRLAAERSDMEQAVVQGSRYIVDGCNRILRGDPGNAVAMPVRSRWQQAGRDIVEGTNQTEPIAGVFHQCMEAVARVRQ